MTSSVPTKAKWVKPLKRNLQVLIDPNGFRMKVKNLDENKVSYVCAQREKLNCRVALVLRVVDEMIVSRSGGEHNHDNNKTESIG